MAQSTPASLVGLHKGSLLETYQIFAEVAGCGSMSRAAWNLDVDVSAVSRHVGVIERAFGVTLFERHRRGVRLTEAGGKVAEHVNHVLAHENELRQNIADLQQLRTGSLRIAATDGAISGPIATAMVEFSRQYPGIQIELFRASSEEVVSALHRGEAELGAGLNIAGEAGIDIVARITDVLAAIVARGHPVARRASVGLDEAFRFPIGTFERNSGVGRTMQRLTSSHQLVLRPTLVTNSLDALKSFAESGAGIAIACPHSVQKDLDTGRLVAVPLDADGPVPMTVVVCVLQSAQRGFAMQRFLEILGGGGVRT